MILNYNHFSGEYESARYFYLIIKILITKSCRRELIQVPPHFICFYGMGGRSHGGRLVQVLDFHIASQVR